MTFNYTKKYNKQSQSYAITSRYEAKKAKLGTEYSQEINIIIRKKKNHSKTLSTRNIQDMKMQYSTTAKPTKFITI